MNHTTRRTRNRLYGPRASCVGGARGLLGGSSAHEAPWGRNTSRSRLFCRFAAHLAEISSVRRFPIDLRRTKKCVTLAKCVQESPQKPFNASPVGLFRHHIPQSTSPVQMASSADLQADLKQFRELHSIFMDANNKLKQVRAAAQAWSPLRGEGAHKSARLRTAPGGCPGAQSGPGAHTVPAHAAGAAAASGERERVQGTRPSVRVNSRVNCQVRGEDLVGLTTSLCFLSVSSKKRSRRLCGSSLRM